MQYDFIMYVNGQQKFTRRLFCKDEETMLNVGHGMMYAMLAMYKRPRLAIYCNDKLVHWIS